MKTIIYKFLILFFILICSVNSNAQVFCGATYSIANNTTSSSISGSVWSSNTIFYVNGLFEINSTLQLSSKEFIMAPGAEIRIVTGGFLIAHLTKFKGCTSMWRSINVSGGNLKITYGLVQDANYGIENNTNQTGSIISTATKFINCYYGIYCVGQVIPSISHCRFEGIGTLMTTYVGQPFPVYNSNIPFSIPYVGIYIKNKRWTINNATGTQLQLCIFKNINNGIIAENCQSSIKNCQFIDVRAETNSGAPNINGYGIRTFLTNTLVNDLYFKGMGNNSYSLSTFINCEYPIYTKYTSGVVISDTKISNASYGINIEYAKKILISNNTIIAFGGILLNNVTNSVMVENNAINNSSASYTYPATPSLYRFGIIVNAPPFLPSGGTAPLQFINNSISLNGNNSFYLRGIEIIGAAGKTWITENDIILNNVTNWQNLDAYGIKADLINGSVNYRGLIKNNSILGPSDYATSTAISNAIALRSCTYTNVSCNTIDATTRGILIQQNNNDCYINGNEINHHKYGMFLNSVASLPSQSFTNNTWLDGFNYPGNSARWDVSNTFIPTSYFFVNPNTISGQLRSPQVVSPQGINPTIYPTNNWFQNPFSQSGYNCAMQNLMPIGITNVDYKTIQNQIIASEFNEQMLYNSMMNLYEKLDSLDTLTLAFEHFRDSLYHTNIESFHSLKSTMRAFYVVDEASQMQIDSLFNYIENNDHNKQYFDSLLSTQMPNTSGYDIISDSLNHGITDSILIQTISGFQSDPVFVKNILLRIDSINQLNDLARMEIGTIYHNIDTYQKSIISNAMTMLDEIRPENTIEENYKSIYALTLNNWSKDYLALNEDEIATLEQMAFQCPYTGGPAVLMARGLLSGNKRFYSYNDQSICLNDSINYRLGPDDVHNSNSIILNSSDIRLFPNPFIGDLQIINNDFTYFSNLLIYNLIGKVVYQQKLNSNNVTIDLSGLTQGIYRACISDSKGQIIKNEKLIKVK
jgi:hypothetical protein